MAIARDLGGYTGAQADELRRTMGNTRKLLTIDGRARAAPRRRMVGQGIPPNVAAQIVDDLQSFANYGFPESHAWSFALIAYATAYLKTHCPAEFYAALLNSWPMGFYPVSTLVHDAIRRGVEVRGPCLSRWGLGVHDRGDGGPRSTGAAHRMAPHPRGGHGGDRGAPRRTRRPRGGGGGGRHVSSLSFDCRRSAPGTARQRTRPVRSRERARSRSGSPTGGERAGRRYGSPETDCHSLRRGPAMGPAVSHRGRSARTRGSRWTTTRSD